MHTFSYTGHNLSISLTCFVAEDGFEFCRDTDKTHVVTFKLYFFVFFLNFYINICFLFIIELRK